MADRTFTYGGVNHLWSTAGNWNTGVPTDGQSVLVDTGQSCIFDADQSAWTTGINGLTINGTLSFSLTTSAHMFIKAAAIITGSGTFNVGSSGAGNNIPFAVKASITGGAAWYINGASGLTMNVYDEEPTHPTIKLNQALSANGTRLYVDTDVTGDTKWYIGAVINVDNVNQAQQSEQRTISNITSTYIDISAGITAAKLSGSFVNLITRNVSLTGVGAAGYVCQNFTSGKLIVAGGAWTTANYRVFSGCTNMVISGGTFSGNTYGLSSCTGASISGGTFSGNGYGLGSCAGASISGGTFSGSIYGLNNCTGASISGGTFSGNTYGLNSCTGASISGGTFSGNTYGLSNFSFKMYACTFSGNTYDIYQCVFTLENITLVSSPDNYLYQNLFKSCYSESINAGNSAGAFKAWTANGITTSVATPVPTGFARSYQIAPTSATTPGFWQRTILVPAGRTVQFTMYMQKTVAMATKPTCQVFLDTQEPLLGGGVLNTFTYPDDTTGTWQSATYTYANTDNYDKVVVVRFNAQNASGYVYTQLSEVQIGANNRGIITGGKL